MPKLYSSKYIIKILEINGFSFISQKGSHCKFRKNSLTVIVPHPKKEIPAGTLKSILRQSNLKQEHFE